MDLSDVAIIIFILWAYGFWKHRRWVWDYSKSFWETMQIAWNQNGGKNGRKRRYK